MASGFWTKIGWAILLLAGITIDRPSIGFAQTGVEQTGVEQATQDRPDEINTDQRKTLRTRFLDSKVYEVEVQQNVTTEWVGGLVKSAKQPIEMRLFQDWEIVQPSEAEQAEWTKKKLGEQIIILQTITRLSLRLNNPTLGDVFADSASPEAPTSPVAATLYKNLKAMVGQQLKLTITPTGKTTRVEWVSQDLVNKSPLADQVFSRKNLVDLVGSLVELPEHSLAFGESWFLEKKTPDKSAMISTTYTLSKVSPDDPNAFEIVVKPELKQLESTDGITLESHQGEGSIVYHWQSQRIQETSLNQKIVLKIAAEQTMTQTIESRLRMTIVPKSKEASDSGSTPTVAAPKDEAIKEAEDKEDASKEQATSSLTPSPNSSAPPNSGATQMALTLGFLLLWP